MSENVIWLSGTKDLNDAARRKDCNVALVESAFQFVVAHPFTDGDRDHVRTGMTLHDATLLRDVIDVALKIAARGPAEFDATASKDMAYYEHWLRHYERQIGRFLGPENADPLPGDWA